MKKLFLLVMLLFLCGRAESAPTNTMNITPVAVDAATIEAADENSRNNEVNTKFNAHSHEDLTQTSSVTFLFGSGTDSGTNMSLKFSNSTNVPAIRWNGTLDAFQYSEDQSTWMTLPMTQGESGKFLVSQGSDTQPEWSDNPELDGALTISEDLTISGSMYLSGDLTPSGSESGLVTIVNDTGNSALRINQTGPLGSSPNHSLYVISSVPQLKASLGYFHIDNASSTVDALFANNEGSGVCLGLAPTTGVSAAAINLGAVDSVTGTTEGMLYADDDGMMYYRSNTNWAACNAATDFSEIMECVGNGIDYEDGEVIVLTTNKKVTKSNTAYQTNVIGIVSELKGRSRFEIDRTNRPYHLPKTTADRIAEKEKKGIPLTALENMKKAQVGKTFAQLNQHKVQVGLIGMVDCKVCDEGGDIQVGDILVSSSRQGYAMKGTLSSIGQLSAVIGKARENINFNPQKPEGRIAIIVGVK